LLWAKANHPDAPSHTTDAAKSLEFSVWPLPHISKPKRPAAATTGNAHRSRDTHTSTADAYRRFLWRRWKCMSIYPYTLAGIFIIQYNRIFSCRLFFEGSQWIVTNDSLVCDIYKVSISFI